SSPCQPGSHGQSMIKPTGGGCRSSPRNTASRSFHCRSVMAGFLLFAERINVISTPVHASNCFGSFFSLLGAPACRAVASERKLTSRRLVACRQIKSIRRRDASAPKSSRLKDKLKLELQRAPPLDTSADCA